MGRACCFIIVIEEEKMEFKKYYQLKLLKIVSFIIKNDMRIVLSH